jgi:signal recognition particle receptor subunit alpha
MSAYQNSKAACWNRTPNISTMLDAFEIITASGVVLWSRSYAPIGAGLIDSLINDVFIEEKARVSTGVDSTQKPTYRKDGYTLKWTVSKDIGLIFVVCPLSGRSPSLC